MTVATAEPDTDYDDFDWSYLSDQLPPSTTPAPAEDRKPSMAERVDAEIDANPLGHQWVIQSTISVDFRTAKRAAFRGMFRAEDGMRVDALEVMCHCCRRPFDEVADGPVHDCETGSQVCVWETDEDGEVIPDQTACTRAGLVICPSQIDNTYLIGGDQREREKRIKRIPVGPIVYAVIDRRGLNGYTVNDGR